MKDKKQTSALAISQALATEGVAYAETHLALIAEKHGDQELSVIVGKLPPADVLAIVRECDSGKPSILHGFITPEKFGEIIRLESQYGTDQSMATSYANGMISAIVFGEGTAQADATPADFLREVFKSEEGTKEFMKFVLPFATGEDEDLAHRREKIVHFLKFGTYDLMSEEPDGPNDNDDMSWQQAIKVIRNELPDELELFVIALGDYKNKESLAPKASEQKPVVTGKKQKSAL